MLTELKLAPGLPTVILECFQNNSNLTSFFKKGSVVKYSDTSTKAPLCNNLKETRLQCQVSLLKFEQDPKMILLYC